MEYALSGGVCWRSGVSSTASMVAGLGGVAPRGLDDGRVMMGKGRVVELSSTMAASTAGLARSIP